MASASPPLLVWLGETGCDDVALTGGKTANLSKLASRCLVPPGFCLSVQAHAQWSATLLEQDSEEFLAGFPQQLICLVRQAYAELAERCQIASPVVAVRSSGVDEDGAVASFAGQFLSCLNIRGLEAVLDAIVRCWASAETPRAREYRARQGLGPGALAVLVQEMVAADAAAVVFSRGPTGSADNVLINANYGIGESIVSGTANPDTWTLRRTDLSQSALVIGQKATMTVFDGGAGTREVPVPRILRQRACLERDQVEALGRLALTLEATMGWPVDLECAFRGDKLYVLQCRPITTVC
jgi:phosphoenolpyruvate synthase/pyruvate phosphate dikinase